MNLTSWDQLANRQWFIKIPDKKVRQRCYSPDKCIILKIVINMHIESRNVIFKKFLRQRCYSPDKYKILKCNQHTPNVAMSDNYILIPRMPMPEG